MLALFRESRKRSFSWEKVRKPSLPPGDRPLPTRLRRPTYRGPTGPINGGLPTRSRYNTRRVSSKASMLSTGEFSGRPMPLNRSLRSLGKVFGCGSRYS